jgi:hypothetical protein
MAGYQKPGITVTEVDTPNTTIVVDRPTVIGLVGLAQGNEARSEVVLLRDNDEHQLEGVNPITSPASEFVVRDINLLNAVYTEATDYVLTENPNTGVLSIKRNLHTTMTSRENVVVVAQTTSPTGVAYCIDQNTLAGHTTMNYENESSVMVPSNSNGTTTTIKTTGGAPGENEISAQRAGAYVLGTDYAVSGDDSAVGIARTGAFGVAPGSCRIMSGQTVFVSYTTSDGANRYIDEPVQLSGTGSQTLGAAAELVDSDSIVVRNRTGMGASTVPVRLFTAGSNGPQSAGVDFEFTFDPSAASASSFTMIRNVEGPTTMGVAINRVNVRIDYKYIPADYYSPTLFTSFQEVEAKYGPAFDSFGNIVNPLSAGAYVCFRSGSNEIIAQPLFSTGGSGQSKIRGDEASLADWTKTLESLRGQTAINVLVPIVGQSTLDVVDPDATIHAIHLQFVRHVEEMQRSNEYVIAVFGEDATSGNAVTNNRTTTETLRSHARVFGQQLYPERSVLVSPAAFKISNPGSGKPALIGGQYVAATLAGMLARGPVQESLTRKQVTGINDVATYSNESDKDRDAESGLLVVESKNNVCRVRHAITTAVDDENKRELNAMRSKFFMIESLQRTLDENVIGKVMADDRAAFIVSTQVTSLLNFLRSSGAISNYFAVSATRSGQSPTSMVVRFTYSLPYVINNIEVVLSLDTFTGNINAQ